MKTITLLFAILILTTSGTVANTIDKMRLHGSGTAYYLKFIKVYDASLYTETVATEEEILAGAVSKCLFLTYDVSLSQGDFIKAADSVLQRQFKKEELQKVQQEIDKLHEGYQDVKEGDSYSLCYDSSEQTTTLSLNGSELVKIESKPFASTYFSIWLGQEKPLDKRLRDNLLARK